tara:strand:+ start:13690 stop:14535 length:846 start_codon:yes stop_codon:yes gene_type:complete
MADLTSTANVKEYLGIAAAITTYDTLIGNLVTRVSRAIETYCNRTFNSTTYVMERYDPSQTPLIYIKNYPIISLTRVTVGRRGVLEITHSDSGSVSATVSVSATGISTIMLGGSNAGTNTDLFATYTTLSSLATQITTHTSWTASTVDSDFDNIASLDLIPVGSRETQDATINMEVPDLRLMDYQVDFTEGSIYRGAGYFGQWNDVFIDYTGGYATIPADLEQIAIEITAEVFQSRTTNNTLKSEKIGDYSYTNVDSSKGIQSVVIGHSDDLAMWRREVYV